MTLYCIDDFKNAFDDLIKRRSYQDLEIDIIEYFFNKEVNQLISGKRLNHSQDAPYIKKRLDGRGGYRVYFLLKIVDQNLYLMFVHPKTGSQGSDNITDDSKAKIYKDVLESIQSDNLYKLTLNQENTKIIFSKL
jgi:hypothetical protein